MGQVEALFKAIRAEDDVDGLVAMLERARPEALAPTYRLMARIARGA
jgi:hypothetical protein